MSTVSPGVNPRNDDAASAGTTKLSSTDHRSKIARSSQAGMIVCPVCGLLNPPGSVACSRCATDCALTEITLHLNDALAASQFTRPPTGMLVAPRRTSLILELDGLPLTVPMADVITVGRGGRIVEGQSGPDVDLSLFGAALKGVSRRHIKLTRDNLLVRVTDLDSTNGTWLNGQPIRPYGWRVLRHGDELKLGTLTLKVLMDPDM